MIALRIALLLLATLAPFAVAADNNLRDLTGKRTWKKPDRKKTWKNWKKPAKKCEPKLEKIRYHDTKGKPSKVITSKDAWDYTHYVCIKDVHSVGIEAVYKKDCKAKKVDFKLEYPDGMYDEGTERVEPWSLYKNKGEDIYGKYLKEGKYKLKVWPNGDYKNSKEFKVILKEKCHY